MAAGKVIFEISCLLAMCYMVGNWMEAAMVCCGNVPGHGLSGSFGGLGGGRFAIGTEFADNEVRGVVCMDGVRKNRPFKSVK